MLSSQHVVGLSTWPAWRGPLNSGYFASVDESRRGRAGVCAGDTCCAAHASNSVLAQKWCVEVERCGAGECQEEIMREREYREGRDGY